MAFLQDLRPGTKQALQDLISRNQKLTPVDCAEGGRVLSRYNSWNFRGDAGGMAYDFREVMEIMDSCGGPVETQVVTSNMLADALVTRAPSPCRRRQDASVVAATGTASGEPMSTQQQHQQQVLPLRSKVERIDVDTSVRDDSMGGGACGLTAAPSYASATAPVPFPQESLAGISLPDFDDWQHPQDCKARYGVYLWSCDDTVPMWTDDMMEAIGSGLESLFAPAGQSIARLFAWSHSAWILIVVQLETYSSEAYYRAVQQRRDAAFHGLGHEGRERLASLLRKMTGSFHHSSLGGSHRKLQGQLCNVLGVFKVNQEQLNTQYESFKKMQIQQEVMQKQLQDMLRVQNQIISSHLELMRNSSTPLPALQNTQHGVAPMQNREVATGEQEGVQPMTPQQFRTHAQSPMVTLTSPARYSGSAERFEPYPSPKHQVRAVTANPVAYSPALSAQHQTAECILPSSDVAASAPSSITVSPSTEATINLVRTTMQHHGFGTRGGVQSGIGEPSSISVNLMQHHGFGTRGGVQSGIGEPSSRPVTLKAVQALTVAYPFSTRAPRFIYDQARAGLPQPF